MGKSEGKGNLKYSGLCLPEETFQKLESVRGNCQRSTFIAKLIENMSMDLAEPSSVAYAAARAIRQQQKKK